MESSWHRGGRQPSEAITVSAEKLYAPNLQAFKVSLSKLENVVSLEP